MKEYLFIYLFTLKNAILYFLTIKTSSSVKYFHETILEFKWERWARITYTDSASDPFLMVEENI